MLWTIFLVLLVLWLVGFIGFHVVAWYIHILLIIALVVLVIQLIGGRRANLKPATYSVFSFRAGMPGRTGRHLSYGAWEIGRHKEIKTMNKDQVTGKVEQAAGRVKQGVGETLG